MAPIFKTFGFDTDSIDKDIESKKTTTEEIRGHMGKAIDNLMRGGLEVFKGKNTANGYPEEILVGGKDEGSIQGGYKKAIQGTPLGDYTQPEEGKIYKR